MKRLTIAGLAATLSLFSASHASAQLTTPIGVQFGGRTDLTGNPPATALAQQDVAGVLPQISWNFIDDQSAGNNGESGNLQDTNLVSTTVTLAFACNDSWYNDVEPAQITKPNARLMNGIIKSSAGGGVPGVFTFKGV